MGDFDISLTLEQQIEIEKLKLIFKQSSKVEIEKIAISLAIQSLGYLNAYKSILKKGIL